MEWGAEYSHGGYCALIDPSQLGNWRQVVGAGTINTLSSWTDLTTSCPYDADGFLFSFANTTSNVSCLIDIGIDPSGGTSFQIIAPQLLWASHQLRTNDWFHVPVTIPAGSRVAVRHQSSTAPTDVRCAIHLITAGSWAKPTVSKVVAIGANTATSSGVQLDPGGSSQTYPGSFTTIGTAPNDLCALCVKIGGINNTAPTNTSFALEIAVGAGPDIIMEQLRFASGSTGDNYGPLSDFWLPVSVPSGATLAAKAKCASVDATDRLFKAVLYGLVK